METDSQLQTPVPEMPVNKKKDMTLCTSLSSADLSHVWDTVSRFIHRNLQSQRGVTIPSLGVFSFEQNKLDVGGNKFLLIQRPVFQLMEKVCQTHGLKQTKYTVNGSVPVPPLNYSVIAQESGFDRDSVESAVREMVSVLNRSVAAQKTVEFTFTGIGRLHIRAGNAKFKFFKELVEKMENGGRVIQTMQDRPGTADSIMSERPPSRAFSVSLPVKEPLTNGAVKLETIPEDGIFEEPNRMEVHPPDSCCLPYGEELETDRCSVTSRASCLATNRQPAPMSTASDFALQDLLASTRSAQPTYNDTCRSSCCPELAPAPGPDTRRVQLKSPPECTCTTPPRVDSDTGLAPQPCCESPAVTSECQQRPPLTPPVTSNRLLLNRSKTWLSHPDQQVRPGSSASITSSCGHPLREGQELCYLCHQRALRNVPVSFKEEFKKREEEEDRLLQTYQQMKDNEYILKEQEKMLNRRHDAQKASAFNLGIAEAVRQKNEFKDPKPYPSYIMKHRPLTPPKYIKQQSLRDALVNQIEVHKTTEDKQKSDESFLGKLEQIQLAEELAAQRRKHLEDKLKKQTEYNKALAVQVRNKPEQIPPSAADGTPEEPLFGKNDVTEEKLLERRRKAQELQRQQEEELMMKKREEILKKIQDQKYEEEVIKRSKSDLLRDRAVRYQRLLANRKELEDDWQKAAREKRERDLVQRLHDSVGDNVLVHEQCDKYHRCAQCRRRLPNVGETNIWCESYYVPGSRYIC